MEKLDLKHSSLMDALTTLENGVQRYKKAIKILESNEDETFKATEIFEMARDSLIQKFEYCFELLWKYLVVYLEDKENIAIPVISPRTVFRTAGKAQLLSEPEVLSALEMADQRNKTSHIYKEEIADLLAKQIPTFYDYMMMCAKRFTP